MPLMDWSGDDIYENFKLYKQKLALYFEDENITEKPVRARKILRTIGDKGLLCCWDPQWRMRNEKNQRNF